MHLICIAADFNRYDEHAVQQINRNIELMRYRYFGNELLLLELVNAQTADAAITKTPPATSSSAKSAAATNKSKSADKTHEERLAEASPEIVSLYNRVCEYAAGLGDEVQRKELKLYTAFKRIKNFLSIVVQPQNKDPRLQLYLKLNLHEDELEESFSRDVTNTGHWGTGNLELNLRNEAELEKTFTLIQKSYQAN